MAPQDGTRRIVQGKEDDLVLLSTVSEQAIVENLQARFSEDSIYTYIGPVLLSVNPFRDISGLYSKTMVARYTNCYLYERAPHVFGIADEAYRNMRSHTRDQCVLVSGESGAGKTEAAKKLMEYISAVSGSLHKKHDVTKVKNALLATNPLLEAFGNAKTLRNDNSSRFGKLMEIQMDFSGVPIGGCITNYLLEKPRIVAQAKGERNFHIFYQLFHDGKVKQQLGLGSPESFEVLAKSGCTSVKSIDDKADMAETVQSMSAVGISAGQQLELFKLVGAVMWLGNVRFDKEGSKCRVSRDAQAALSQAAQLLQVKAADLERALTQRTIITRNESTASPLERVEECLKTRDALAKALYSRAFDRLVLMANQTLKSGESEKSMLNIRVLDIYGFEVFESNSFEQLCINFCNEKLQQLFIELTLKAEQDEYAQEGIAWKTIEFFNNKVVCDLVEVTRPAGVFALLDEESIYPQGTDASLLAKLDGNLGRHAHYGGMSKDKSPVKLPFTIKHYAGNVVYSCEGMLDKNKDMLFRDLIEVCGASGSQLVASLFPEAKESHNLKKPVTSATQFKGQMGDLIVALSKCEPHYIRCIKPNDDKRGGLLVADRVAHQVRYLGLQENVRVRKAGFVFRREFPKFVHRYKMLSPKLWPRDTGDARRDTETILQQLGVSNRGGAEAEYQFGKTKVFLRQPATLFTLEAARDKRLHEVVGIMQRLVRQFLARKFYAVLRDLAATQFINNKRRRGSWVLHCAGDYMYAKTNAKLDAALAGNRTPGMAPDAARNVVFANTVDKLSRKGKMQPRTLLVTRQGIYLANKLAELRRAQPLQSVTGLQLSTFADGFLVISFAPQGAKPTPDMVVSAIHKAEVVATLLELSKGQIKVRYADQIQLTTKTGPKTLSFAEAPELGNKGVAPLLTTPDKQFMVKVPPRMASKAEHQIRSSNPPLMDKQLKRVQARERNNKPDNRRKSRRDD